MNLRIAENLTLPLEAVTQTFSILAKRGVGKTHTGVVMTEEMLKAGQVVVAVDPVGVWWGLRSSKNGRSDGFNGHGIHLTDLGVDKLGKGFQPLPTGEALREHWLTKLPKGERQIFQILCLAWPKAQSRDFLSEQTGYKRSSRDAYLARLTTRQLVEAVGPGEVKAADTLFEA